MVLRRFLVQYLLKGFVVYGASPFLSQNFDLQYIFLSRFNKILRQFHKGHYWMEPICRITNSQVIITGIRLGN